MSDDDENWAQADAESVFRDEDGGDDPCDECGCFSGHKPWCTAEPSSEE